MNTKLSKRILASVLCLMMVFTLAFSSTEVLADSPNGEEADMVSFGVSLNHWEKSENGDFYELKGDYETYDVERGATLEETYNNLKKKLPDAQDLSDSMKFVSWDVSDDEAYGEQDNDSDFLWINAYALYSDGTNEPSFDQMGTKITVDCYRRGYYSSEQNGAFYRSNYTIMILSNSLTNEQIISKLNNSSYATIVGEPVSEWTITNNGGYYAKANYSKKAVNVSANYNADSNYPAPSYGRIGVWVDEVTDEKVKTEVNKIVKHNPNLNFTGWTITRDDDNYGSGVDAGYSFTANYSNQAVDVTIEYCDNYGQHFDLKTFYLNDTSDASIIAEINKLGIQHDPKCGFKNWTITKDEGGHYKATANYEEQRLELDAAYFGDTTAGVSYNLQTVYVKDTSDASIIAELNKLGIKHDPKCGFKNWAIDRYGNIIMATATYTNTPVFVNYNYVTSDGNGNYFTAYGSTRLYNSNPTKESVVASLNKMSIKHALTCKGWDVLDEQLNNPTLGRGHDLKYYNYTVKAKYDKYPAGLTLTYLNKNGELVNKRCGGLYASNTKLKDVIAAETSDKRSDTVFTLVSFNNYSLDQEIPSGYGPYSGKKFNDMTVSELSMSSFDIRGTYKDGSIKTVYYPTLNVDRGHNYAENRDVKVFSSAFKYMLVPNEVDTQEEMIAFLQKAGYMGTLKQYQALVPDVVGFGYADGGSSIGVMIRYANGSPSINYSPAVDPSANHTLSNPKYTWSEDHKTCKVTYTCNGKNCGAGKSHTFTYNCKVTSKVTKKATCTAKGSVTYTATSTAPGKSKDTNSVTVAIDPIKHTYGKPVFTWSADGKTCKATYTCTGCKKKVTSKCKVTSKVKTKATCTKKGVTTYTATSGKYSSTNNVADIPINAKAHSYGAPVFKWSADGKTCTATYTCKTCNKKVTSKCKVTSKVKTKATCSKKGVTTYTATSGKYSSPKNVADIPMIAHTLVTKTTPATAKVDGKIDKVCSVCNKTIKTTKINKITSMKVSNATYNKGQEVKPQVTVLDSKGSTINPKYYTVTYANNKEVGTGSVTVNFKGLYSGKLTKTFAINPKATAVAKASSPKKGQVAVNWKALPVSEIDGYQIQVSANANFKNAKTVSVVQKSKAVNAKTITGLKKGNYYIRIRTVKTDADGKTHYSSWAKYKNAVAVK